MRGPWQVKREDGARFLPLDEPQLPSKATRQAAAERETKTEPRCAFGGGSGGGATEWAKQPTAVAVGDAGAVVRGEKYDRLALPFGPDLESRPRG